MQDRDISSIEFDKVLQEAEKHPKLNEADIRNHDNIKVKQITKEQQEKLFEQERKEGKTDFLQEISKPRISILK